jgi:glycosyltransferase involved in cell wall biosynthesis
MRILVIYPYAPFPIVRGTFQRTFHLLRELARRNTVDFFALDEGACAAHHADVFRRFCARVHLQPFVHPEWPRLIGPRLLDPLPATVRHWEDPAAHAALAAFTAGQDYDLIYFCDLVMWPYVKRLPHGCPRVMDRSRVDLMFQTEELRTLTLTARERLGRRENRLKLGFLEREAAAQLAATIVCGPDDETFLRRHVRAAAEIAVLPNGCDPAFFDAEAHPPQPPEHPAWLFCGAMDYSPNVDGIRWYFEAVDGEVRATLPERRVNIVGKSPVPAVRGLARIPGVAVTGEVPDVRPHYQSNLFQIVPLRIGGGTRLKIVESLSIGCPVVSTTIGAQGLELRDGEHLLLADTPREFAAATRRLATDPALRERLRTAGRRQVLDLYGWPRLGGRLHSFLESLVSVSA